MKKSDKKSKRKKSSEPKGSTLQQKRKVIRNYRQALPITRSKVTKAAMKSKSSFQAVWKEQYEKKRQLRRSPELRAGHEAPDLPERRQLEVCRKCGKVKNGCCKQENCKAKSPNSAADALTRKDHYENSDFNHHVSLQQQKNQEKEAMDGIFPTEQEGICAPNVMDDLDAHQTGSSCTPATSQNMEEESLQDNRFVESGRSSRSLHEVTNAADNHHIQGEQKGYEKHLRAVSMAGNKENSKLDTEEYLQESATNDNEHQNSVHSWKHEFYHTIANVIDPRWWIWK